MRLADPGRLDLGPSRHRRLRRRSADVLVRGGIPGGHREGDARAAHRLPPRVLRAGVDVPGHRRRRDALAARTRWGSSSDIPRATPKPRTKAKWGLGDRYTANVRPVTAEEEPQVHMVFAVPGIPASDPQRTALSVMTHVLGGGMSSRLFQTVRERNGLCYSIYSHHAGFDDTGLFAIATATRPKDARKATSLAFKEFRKIAAKRVAADELAAAKSAMIGRLLRSTETAIASARFYGSRWRARLPLETPDDRAEAIMKVTADEVQAVAERIAVRHRRRAHGPGRSDRPGRRAALRDRVRPQRAEARGVRRRGRRRSSVSATRSRSCRGSARDAPAATGSARRRRARLGVSSRCTLGWCGTRRGPRPVPGSTRLRQRRCDDISATTRSRSMPASSKHGVLVPDVGSPCGHRGRRDRGVGRRAARSASLRWHAAPR